MVRYEELNRRNILSQDEKVAVLYSLPSIGEYIIEIIDKNSHHFIENENEVLRFGNIGAARTAIKDQKVTKAFLALDKTYQEPGMLSSSISKENYDYLPLKLVDG